MGIDWGSFMIGAVIGFGMGAAFLGLSVHLVLRQTYD